MSYPVLYILMRTDMESLNWGKSIAQGAHAANQFTSEMEEYFEEAQHLGSFWASHYEEWLDDRGFGTTIVLDVKDEDTLQKVVDNALMEGYMAGVTHDPSYPIRDGKVTHLLPVDTCGYVFVCNKDKKPTGLEGLKLHK